MYSLGIGTYGKMNIDKQQGDNIPFIIIKSKEWNREIFICVHIVGGALFRTRGSTGLYNALMENL
jgi:hypothetical protein